MKKLFLLSLLGIVSAVSAASWKLSAPDNLPPWEKAAVDDLVKYLELISGEKIALTGDAPHTVFFGRPAPSVRTALPYAVRRVKGENGNLYVWGGGDRYSAAFAVYDLLEKHYKCRWFTPWDEVVPRRSGLGDTDKIDLITLPGFTRVTYTSAWKMDKDLPEVADFLRRRRILTDNDGRDGELLGIYHHSLGAYYPSGMVPAGKRRAESVFGPYKLFKDEKNFEKHPEYFSLNKAGRRVWNHQVCFANPDLRKELTRHCDLVISTERKDDGPAFFSLKVNDNAEMCCCKPCAAMMKKYGTKGGPYYDYVIEYANHLAEKFPGVRLEIQAYRPTEIPPNVKLPGNVILGYAPLGKKDFLKPYAHASNKKAYALLRQLGQAADNVSVHYYATPFPCNYVINEFPLCVYSRRYLADVHTLRQNNVTMLSIEIGGGGFSPWGFNELNNYLCCALADNPHAGIEELTGEFAACCYGKAAELMLRFIDELTSLIGMESRRQRWDPDPQLLSYLTPDNLLRWNRHFDDMEKLVQDNPVHLRHVRNVRVALDQAIMAAAWKFKAANLPLPLAPQSLLKRTLAGLKGGTAPMRNWGKGWYLERHQLGIKQEYVAALLLNKGMPENLKHVPGSRIYRLAPACIKALPEDKTSFSGVRVNIPEKALKKPQVWHVDRSAEYYVKSLPEVKVDKGGFSWRAVYAGKTALFEDCWMKIGSARFLLSRIFDPDDPGAEYRLYLMLRRDGSGKLFISELICIRE